MSWCCINCFRDELIVSTIQLNKAKGNCDYCGSKSQPVIDPKNLTKKFECFFNIYDKAQRGAHWDVYAPNGMGELADDIIFSDLKPFYMHIQDDWNVFSKDLNDDKLIDLLSDIYNNSRVAYEWAEGEDVALVDSAIYYDNIVQSDDKQTLWKRFCHEIRHKNRFFLRSSPVEEILDLLETKKVSLREGNQYYRARLGHELENTNKVPFSEMGKPPATKSSNGRANPRGISYLYTASDINTAISEVRPWKEAIVSIGAFVLSKDVEIVDLTMSKIDSPFQPKDLRKAVEYQQLLETISYEFAKPVSPFESEISYVPTQYLAELIKSEGFHGFKFKSSIAEGENFVFFSDKMVNVTDTFLYKVNKITVSESPI